MQRVLEGCFLFFIYFNIALCFVIYGFEISALGHNEECYGVIMIIF
jgi:hypothetical protein